MIYVISVESLVTLSNIVQCTRLSTRSMEELDLIKENRRIESLIKSEEEQI